MKSLLLLAIPVMGVLAGPPGCEFSPPLPSAEGVGKACKVQKDCGVSQTCLMYSHPECPGAKCQECQLRCGANEDCPAGYVCNLPPLLPDTVPYICAKP